ncbi:MAG: alpha/beta hydrolase [Eggerthellaceae bacterium]|nr:alpha/beta hydrolase [Eggerthellaceae bacterium]
MGYLYEIATTAPAFGKPSHYDAHPPARSKEPAVVPFGDDKQQHFVFWEPDEVAHDAPVLYFHGGGYVFGEAESMKDAANTYNSQGYRFCSVGFREAPRHRFPAMVRDAFQGSLAAIKWMEGRGVSCERIVVGGTCAGGHLAALVCYARWLQEAYRFPAERICACVSIAGVADAADLLVKPFPTYGAWRTQVDLRTEGDTRGDVLKAVERYSPICLVEEEAETCDVPRIPLFVVHGREDTLSPYSSQVRLVEALRHANGEDSVELLTLEDRHWQHMNTTVTMHKDAVEDSPVLSALFAWLAERA